MKKPVVILLHVGYWMIFLLLIFFIIFAFSIEQLNKEHTIHFARPLLFFTAFAIIPGMFSFYSFYTLLYSRFFITKKTLNLFIYGFVTATVSGLIGAFNINLISWYYHVTGLFNDGYTSAIQIIIVTSFVSLLNGIIGLVMKGFIVSYNDIKLKEDLNKKNYEMELALVKNQINPHFLFNTLNNIDVLIQKDPIKASDYLNKLSDIMRFMLYETKADKIVLATELTYIEKYIELQKIRSSNPSYVNYSIEGITDGLLIEPMLFIPFIENAFKHTENKNLENAIYIKITVNKEMIIFECENKFSGKSQNISDHNGLGNGLIEKRLMLLYPNKHQLNITTDNHVYKVNLTLNNVN
ncbi:MAG: histidine kinase [Bacteroidota bacterium]